METTGGCVNVHCTVSPSKDSLESEVPCSQDRRGCRNCDATKDENKVKMVFYYRINMSVFMMHNALAD